MTQAPPTAMPSALSILMVIALLGLAAVALVLAALWIRERRRAHELQGRVANAARSADAFFDLVTHELRSPLASIIGYQELLDDGAYGTLDDRAHEPIDRIGRSARHLLHLIEGLVEVGRLRSGIGHAHTEPVDLRLAAAGVAEALGIYARERKIPVETTIEDDLPTVQSDQDRLIRALDLLAVSAVKHPGPNGLTLHVRRHDLGATFHFAGAFVPTRAADDPAVRYGLRIAAAQGIAAVIGGELEIVEVGEAVTEVVLVVGGSP